MVHMVTINIQHVPLRLHGRVLLLGAFTWLLAEHENVSQVALQNDLNDCALNLKCFLIIR